MLSRLMTFRSAPERAYREFVLAIQKAWAQVDTNVVDMRFLAIIGQIMQAAASLTANIGMMLKQHRVSTAAMMPSATAG